MCERSRHLLNYNVNDINVVSLDIETSTLNGFPNLDYADNLNGFPNLDYADKEIITLSMRKQGKVIILGTRPYKPKRDDAVYVQSRNESDWLKTIS